MIMQDQGNNTFTKEKTDVEKYLTRIIQRYFETENNYSKASIESIIVESLTRFKRFCKDKGKGYLFSFNKKAGHIRLDINSFGGEPAFKKNTAFNKNFGDDIDTVCTGDDPRLSDDRIPFTHTHEYAHIDGLMDALSQLSVPDYIHSHKNKNILDMLTYTGTMPEVDLVVVERIKDQVPMYETNAAKIRAEMTTFQKRQLDDLNSSAYALTKYADDYAINLIFGYQWVQDAKNGMMDSIRSMQDYAAKKFAQMLPKSSYQKLSEDSATIYSLANTGSFAVQMTIDGIKNITNDGRTYAVYNIINESVSLPAIDADSLITMYFQYQDESGNTVKAPLPFMFKDAKGNSVVLQCGIKGNTAVYSTLTSARFAGQGAYDASYNDGKSFILRTQGNALDFYDATASAAENGYSFIDYDPSNTKQKALIASIAATDSFHIGAFYDMDLEAYVNIKEEPCKFNTIEDGGKGVVYYKSGKLYSTMNTNKHEQLYEISIPKLEDYYANPQIYYEVRKKGV